MKKSTSWILFMTLFPAATGFCQSYNDGPNDRQAVINSYQQYTGAQLDIYNGGDYVAFIFKRKGSTFFESDSLQKGTIGYQGEIYTPMPLQYDVARDQLIILNYNKRSLVVLHNSAVDSFSYNQHRFIRLNQNRSENLNNTGFYEILYDGKTRVLASRKKIISDVIQDNEVVRVFSNQYRYYVFKKGTYYWVSNKKEVFNLFSERQHEIKKTMRQQKMKFKRNNFENALVLAASIYDQH